MEVSILAPVLLGCQTPRIEHVPPYVTTAGDDAIELAEIVGMPLDPWQRYIQRGAMGLLENGRFSAAEVGIIVPRQNGKSVNVEVAELSDIYIQGSKVIYTAHLMASCRKMRERLQYLIEDCPDLDREVKQIRTSNEEQSIELKSRARIDFVTRTLGAGRSWTKYRKIYLDEAYALAGAHVSALMPTMFASRNWQIWYVSMAGMKESAALRRVRQRGKKKDPRLAYFEHSVPDEVYRAAPEYIANMPAAWAQANPAFNTRIEQETIAAAQRGMDPDDFAREVLGVWDDPRGIILIDPIFWEMLYDGASTVSPNSGRVFALEATEGLRRGCISSAGQRIDGLAHVEILKDSDGVLDHRPAVAWMVPRAVELEKQYGPSTWMMDASGPARALLADLRNNNIEPVMVHGPELGEAHGAFLKAVMTPERDKVRHLAQEDFREAIEVVEKKVGGDGPWVFSRKLSRGNVIPLLAGALALHGLEVYGAEYYDALASVY